MDLLLTSLALACAVIPATLFLANLRHYRILPPPRRARIYGVSVLIPARDEEASIAAAVDSVLASRGVDLELIVLDDGSTDATASIVAAAASRDSSVRLIHAPPLPPGWCGKQHACWILASHASHDLLCFMDADVRLAPAALARMCVFLQQSGAELVSGFPRQVTVTFLERLLLPLIHFILLGFLPLQWMRRNLHPAFAAGCGQLMFTTREGYWKAGGHAAIRSSLHDGITLPRAFRRAGLRTDLFDATDSATCRMYHSAREVWHGMAKNAVEGLAAPQRIGWITAFLAAGQILPFALLAAGVLQPLATAAAVCSITPRLIAATRFRQSWMSALLHPFGILVLLALQWYSCVRALTGQASTWKGRPYSSRSQGADTRTGCVHASPPVDSSTRART